MAVIDVRAGLDSTGALACWDFLDINGGPAAFGLPYAASAIRLRSQPARSPLRQGPYRALGANSTNFARESAVDELVHASGGEPAVRLTCHRRAAHGLQARRRARKRWAGGNLR